MSFALRAYREMLTLSLAVYTSDMCRHERTTGFVPIDLLDMRVPCNLSVSICNLQILFVGVMPAANPAPLVSYH